MKSVDLVAKETALKKRSLKVPCTTETKHRFSSCQDFTGSES